MTAFGHYTTAREVVQGLDLTGKVALVTGGNAGEANQPSGVKGLQQKACFLLSEHKLVLLSTELKCGSGSHPTSDATAGIGTKTVDALACAGCHVLLTSRSVNADVRLCSRAGQRLKHLLLMHADPLRLAIVSQRMSETQAQRSPSCSWTWPTWALCMPSQKSC